jgi:hypothetical protein
MTMKVRSMAWALALGPVAAGSLAAETHYGGSAVYGAPTGGFRDHFDVSGGVAGFAVVSRPGGALGLRIDGTWLLYGSRTVHAPLPGPAPRQSYEVTTDNWLGQVTVGPQLMAPSGRVRPYVTGFAGLGYFSTTSESRGPLYGRAPSPILVQPVRISTNFDDTTFAYGGAAGFVVELGGGGLALDFGARYVVDGRVSFLTEGDLADDGRGGVQLTPRRASGSFFEIRIGVTSVTRRSR